MLERLCCLRDPTRLFIDYAITPASYIIFKLADTILAKNCLTGELEFCSKSARQVLQGCIDKLPFGGLIHIKSGIYSFDRTIELPEKPMVIQGEGASFPYDVIKYGIEPGTFLQYTAEEGWSEPLIAPSTLTQGGSRQILFKDLSFGMNYLGKQEGYTTWSDVPLLDLRYRDVNLENVMVGMCIGTRPRYCVRTGPGARGRNVFWRNVWLQGSRYMEGALLERDRMILVDLQVQRRAQTALTIKNTGWIFIYNLMITGPPADVSANSTLQVIAEAASASVYIENLQAEMSGSFNPDHGVFRIEAASGLSANVFLNKHGISYRPPYVVYVGAGGTEKLFVKNARVTNLDTGLVEYSENSGLATIPAGSTSVTVSHGLIGTPSKVWVTPIGDPGDRFWVATVGSSTFDIIVATAPGADINFYWKAEM